MSAIFIVVSDGLIVKAKIMNWNGRSPFYVNDRHIHTCTCVSAHSDQ